MEILTWGKNAMLIPEIGEAVVMCTFFIVYALFIKLTWGKSK
jgi:hypothetical protein